MCKYKLILVFVASFFVSNLSGQTLLDKLYDDIYDGQLDDHTRIEAAFIISGADTPTKLRDAKDWYQKILADIRQKNIIKFDRIPSAESLFLYFHTTWLKDYKEKATTLLDIKDRKEFNCVSATVLYNLTCDEVGLTTEAFETPTHVYTIFSYFGDQVMVENTTSMGFNIMKNLANYSRYLAQYYPEEERLKIGLHRLYAYENSKGRKINNTELLGLVCYNLGIFNSEQKNYQKAYEFVELAQYFNEDSRSNRKFEISLYYRWGEQLFNQQDFYQAFEVLADAYYRYPDNADFRRNCHTVYLRALDSLWRKKDWERVHSIILEMNDLDILTQKGSIFQQRTLSNWIRFLIKENRKTDATEAMDLYKSYYGEDVLKRIRD